MAEEIGRAAWNRLRPQGENVETTTTVRPGVVDIETGDGEGEVTVYVQSDGVDVRVGNVQLIVKGSRVTVLRPYPPYPLTRWTVLWEGEVS